MGTAKLPRMVSGTQERMSRSNAVKRSFASVRAALNDQTVVDENARDMRVAKRRRSQPRARFAWRRGRDPVRVSTSSDRVTPTRVNTKETDDRSSGQRSSESGHGRSLAEQSAADAEVHHGKHKGDSDDDASAMVTSARALAEEERRAYELSRREELAADADDLGSTDSEQDASTYEAGSFVDEDVVDKSDGDYAPTGDDDENSEEEEDDEEEDDDDEDDDSEVDDDNNPDDSAPVDHTE